MSIILTAVTGDGIVMAAESRTIKAPLAQVRGGYTSGMTYELVTDSSDKVFLLAGRVGLAYSGPDFDEHGWYFNNEVRALEEEANKGCGIDKLADKLANRLKEALPSNMAFGFHLAAYDGYSPLVATWPPQEPRLGYSKGAVRCGLAMDGETSILRKLLQGERIAFHRMPLRDAIEFAELMVTLACKCQAWFEHRQPVSGGPVDILVLTPERAGFVKHKTLALLGWEIKPEEVK